MNRRPIRRFASFIGLASFTCAATVNTPAFAQDIKTLRIEAWTLFERITRPADNSGLPLWRTWRQGPDVFSRDNEQREPRPFFLGRPKELEELASPPPEKYILYESTYFNPEADKHIQTIRNNESLDALHKLKRREVSEFPPTAVIAKAFWRKVPTSGTTNVGIWDWSTPSVGVYSTREELWSHQQCISSGTKDSCLSAAEYFHVVKVTSKNIGLFKCNVGCLPGPPAGLSPGDSLMLVGLHVAAKTRPDWFWATFWWKGVSRTDGESWTCDNAQRPPQLAISNPWKNYSMDVTVSFINPKPMLAAGNPCGVPLALPNGAQWLATFDPFVEVRLARGRSSTCIDCHSRARTPTTGNPANYVPLLDRTDDYPGLKDFEGRIRTEYNWSLANYFNSLTPPKRK